MAMKLHISEKDLVVGATYLGEFFYPFVWTGEGFLCQACAAWELKDFSFCTRYNVFLPYKLVEYPDSLGGDLAILRHACREAKAAIKEALPDWIRRLF